MNLEILIANQMFRDFQKLKFEMGAPTPIHFLRRFSKAAQADGQTHILSKYFIELAAIDYNLSEYLPSEVSAAKLRSLNRCLLILLQ